MRPAISPNGGSALERRKLEERFGGRLAVNPLLTRKAVSYQGNRNVPGFRWMKYKEGFSQSLVERLLDEFRPRAILDPIRRHWNYASHRDGQRLERNWNRDYASRSTGR